MISFFGGVIMEKMKELHKLVESFEEIYPDRYFNELESLREDFVNSFTTGKIKKMSLNEYIIGKQSRTSFCYRLEVELKKLGGIQGGVASKFGIYYSEKNKNISCTKRYEGENFSLLKEDILSLLEYGVKKDYESIKKSPISPMFKGKILAIYFPKDYQYLFSEDHLDVFIEWFGFDISTFTNLLDKQIFIGELKKEDNIISGFSNLKYMHFLEYALHNESEFTDLKLSVEEEFKLQEQMMDEKILELVMNKPDEKGKMNLSEFNPKMKLPNTRIVINSKEHFSRDPKVVENALRFSGFQCEFDKKHKTFISKRTGKNFVEAHHLIPMSEQINFEFSIDIEPNIVTLCPNCHRRIHLGTMEEKKKMLEELFTHIRMVRLEKCGIKANLAELEEIYKQF